MSIDLVSSEGVVLTIHGALDADGVRAVAGRLIDLAAIGPHLVVRIDAPDELSAEGSELLREVARTAERHGGDLDLLAEQANRT